MLFKKKPQRRFMNWEEYQERMETLELFKWQQATRKQTLTNTLAQIEG